MLAVGHKTHLTNLAKWFRIFKLKDLPKEDVQDVEEEPLAMAEEEVQDVEEEELLAMAKHLNYDQLTRVLNACEELAWKNNKNAFVEVSGLIRQIHSANPPKQFVNLTKKDLFDALLPSHPGPRRPTDLTGALLYGCWFDNNAVGYRFNKDTKYLMKVNGHVASSTPMHPETYVVHYMKPEPDDEGVMEEDHLKIMQKKGITLTIPRYTFTVGDILNAINRYRRLHGPAGAMSVSGQYVQL